MNGYCVHLSRSETHLGVVTVDFDPQSFWHAGNRNRSINRSVSARIGFKKNRHQFVRHYCAGFEFIFVGNIPFLSEWRWFCLLVIRVRKSPYGFRCRYVCRDGCRYGCHRCWNLPIVNHITVIIKKVVLPPTHAAIIIVWYNRCALFMLSSLNLCVCTLRASSIIISIRNHHTPSLSNSIR